MDREQSKAWAGRFSKETDPTVEAFTESISFDWRLYRHDIAASRAHARMLGLQGIVSALDVDAIIVGLDEIEVEIDQGQFSFQVRHEDIHLNKLALLFGLHCVFKDLSLFITEKFISLKHLKLFIIKLF